MCEYNKYIIELFDILKLNPKYKGYYYLYEAISIRLGKPMYKRKIYTVVYPMIAEKYHVTYTSVERNIRTVIDRAWTKEFTINQYKLYGRITSLRTQKPSAAKLIEESVQIIYRMMEKDDNHMDQDMILG